MASSINRFARRRFGMHLAFCILLVGTPLRAELTNSVKNAKLHYERGVAYHKTARYDDAIAEFQQAYALKALPEFLFNIAQAHRLAERWELAIRLYRNFLRDSPNAKNRVEVEQRIAECEAEIARPKETKPLQPEVTHESNGTDPDPPQPPPPPPPTQTEPGKLLSAGIGLLAAGVAVGGGGIGLNIAARGAAAELDRAALERRPYDPALDAQRRTFNALTVGSWVLGGAVAATGAVLLGLSARRGNDKPAASALRFVPGVDSRGLTLSLTGEF